MLFDTFPKAIQYYSVMQSDGNSFCGDVVLGSFNISYRDEDSILEQKYEKQISWDFYHDFILLIEENAYLKKYSTKQQGAKKNGF